MIWCWLAGFVIGFILGALAKIRTITAGIVGIAASTAVVFALMLSVLTWSQAPQPYRLEITFYFSLLSIPLSLLGIWLAAMIRRLRGN
jgi:hypothetical protein